MEPREPGFPAASFLNIDHGIFRPGRVVTLIERSYWEALSDHVNTMDPRYVQSDGLLTITRILKTMTRYGVWPTESRPIE